MIKGPELLESERGERVAMKAQLVMDFNNSDHKDRQI
jgi:hypothetical protein